MIFAFSSWRLWYVTKGFMQRGREIAPRDYGGLEIEMENFLCLLLS